jgi:hypothetical protein
MYESYQDAMCLVREYGKADFFITFTCNPAWPDIQNCLEFNETPSDRPDVVVRVFRIKLQAFLDTLIKERLLGKVEAYNAVVEFQKRGLPHVHLLLYLRGEDKPRTAQDINNCISAELPNILDEPTLHDVIVSNNIHTCSPERCGDGAGGCLKKFPRPFMDETSIDTNSFPLYKRRSDTEYTLRNGNTIDNSSVVPYNPILNRRFNAHINVESCVSIKSVKYINMYMNKGIDIATIAVKKDEAGSEENVIDYDEVEHFKKTRYLGSAEAFWRLNGFWLSKMSHSVLKLAVHLPEKNFVTFCGRCPTRIEHKKEAPDIYDTI